MELSLRDVARLLNVPDQTVSRWVRQNELPALRIRGQYRVNKVELQEWALARNLRVSTELFAPGGQIEQLPSLSDALERGGVHFEVPGKRRDEVLGAVTDLEGIPNALNRSLLFQLLLGRESLASTGIGGGIAIPHPRDPLVVQIDEPVVLLAFLQNLVDFESIDRQPVSVLFVLLSPSVRTHLQMLSRLMFALHDDLLRELLRSKMPADAIVKRMLELEANRTLSVTHLGNTSTNNP
jgi:PTS system nitrogen regulatory IIA component